MDNNTYTYPYSELTRINLEGYFNDYDSSEDVLKFELSESIHIKVEKERSSIKITLVNDYNIYYTLITSMYNLNIIALKYQVSKRLLKVKKEIEAAFETAIND